MTNRISVGVQQAIDLWLDNHKLSVLDASALAGVSHTSLYRAIKRLKLKRKK